MTDASTETEYRHHQCNAYIKFKGMVVNLESAYEDYDRHIRSPSPTGSPADSPTAYQAEFYRGAIIRIMAIWEAYVYDILSEGFRVVLDLGDDCWGKKRIAIQNALSRRQKLKGKSAPWEPIAYDALEEDKALDALLNEHCKNALKNITPVFGSVSGGRSIDESFERLFDPPSQDRSIDENSVSTTIGKKKKSSSKIKSLADFIYPKSANPNAALDPEADPVDGFSEGVDFEATSDPSAAPNPKADPRPVIKVYTPSYEPADSSLHAREAHSVKPDSSVLVQNEAQGVRLVEKKGLDNISRLYYGLRCVLCHGDPLPTLEEGVLKNFPKTTVELGIEATEESKTEGVQTIIDLFEEIENKKENTTVSYLSALNMLKFVEVCARLLRKAVAGWVEDHFDVKIWDSKGDSLRT